VQQFAEISSILGSDARDRLQNITTWMNSQTSRVSTTGILVLTYKNLFILEKVGQSTFLFMVFD